MRQTIELRVNDAPQVVAADPQASLLGVLRETLDLTGAKYGCGEAQCGACIVLVDGQATPSCVTPVGAVAGKDVLTVEGLAAGGRLHPVQQAFIDEEALQCGFCTPGMVMSAVALLQRTPDPDEAEIVEAMQQNLCRCGVYPRIVRAVRRAAQLARSSPVGAAPAGTSPADRAPERPARMEA